MKKYLKINAMKSNLIVCICFILVKLSSTRFVTSFIVIALNINNKIMCLHVEKLSSFNMKVKDLETNAHNKNIFISNLINNK